MAIGNIPKSRYIRFVDRMSRIRGGTLLLRPEGLVKAPLGPDMLSEAVAQTSEGMSIWSLSHPHREARKSSRSYPSIKDS